MANQRRVNNQLGKNISKDHEKLYQMIEVDLGLSEKRCSRSMEEPHPKYKFVHEGPNPLPIREFNFQKSSKDYLQPNCRACERKYRRGRSDANHNRFDNLTDDEVRIKYNEIYGEIKRCGRCERNLYPTDFPISRGMESGLHNMCYDCQSNYHEAMGDRWIIYSPDGRTVHKRGRNLKCVKCSSVENLHMDHRWPVAIGGTDKEQNFQVLCQSCNSKKSISVEEFKTISDIHYDMICERYHHILNSAKQYSWYVRSFEIKIKEAVQIFLEEKASMTDEELKSFFVKEKRRNNRKHDENRCVAKFRKYYSNKLR